ncbi:hypothetical protein MVEN_01953900 [Mycena venus]|uniref:F-box domain-containing protein n=1 Tax=Mycena venus TaxID=2733690 RepID=A0A8H7CLH2_9AGAR|nr:hypothetical protein MVEN_01953900 [Mycena venus]
MEIQPVFIEKPRLPTEIVDQVLRNFDSHEDRRTLCDCGLVSHTWLVLSRTILFFSIFITPFRMTPNNDTLLKSFRGATVRPYVRDVRVGANPTADWTKTQLPKLLAQFPALTTLRLTDRWELLRQWEIYTELEFFLGTRPARKAGIVAKLHRAFTITFPRFTRRKTTVDVQSSVVEADDDGPFAIPERPPLDQLRIVHIEYPAQNLLILSLLAPPAFDTLHLTLHVYDREAESVHASLRAAGTGLRTLVLWFPLDIRIGRPSTPLATTLRTLHLCARNFPVSPWAGAPVPCPTDALILIAAHLLECVLIAPHLEELIIDTDVLDTDEIGAVRRHAARVELDRVLRTLPTLNTVHIPL